MNVKLNFRNESNDVDNSQVLIFGSNAEASNDETAVAWKVIRNCGQGCRHPFVYSSDVEVNMIDPYANHTRRMHIEPGQEFKALMTSSGTQLEFADNNDAPNQYTIANQLQDGSITVQIWRSGSVYAAKSGVLPAQKVSFEFKPTIFIGVASQVVEGEVVDSAVVSSINTEISLLGLASADIVMRGGGGGANSVPFTFTLENIVAA